MSKIEGTRRGFIAAAVVTAVGSTAFAGLGKLTGEGIGPGIVSVTPTEELGSTELTSNDAWMAAIGSSVAIHGEHGVVMARVASVTPGVTGGERPAGVREQPLDVLFETDPDRAPDGNTMYDLDRTIGGLGALFLSRGETVLGRATLLAILN